RQTLFDSHRRIERRPTFVRFSGSIETPSSLLAAVSLLVLLFSSFESSGSPYNQVWIPNPQVSPTPAVLRPGSHPAPPPPLRGWFQAMQTLCIGGNIQSTALRT